MSRSVAERLWPGRDPIGQRVSMEDHPGPDDWLAVVGEVDDVLQDGITVGPGAALCTTPTPTFLHRASPPWPR